MAIEDLGMVLNLTTTEVSVLRQVLEAWLDGIEEAVDQTIEDPNLDTPEKLVKATCGLSDSQEIISGIHRRLGLTPA